MTQKNCNNLKLINMADIEVKEVEWLWYPYIPYGKITIIQGDPGEGKTTFVLKLAALLSRGDVLPEQADQPNEKIKIIYQTAEDGLSDTIKPRLIQAGADCSNVLVIDESMQGLSMGDKRIEEAIVKTGARLVVLDPIQAYLGAEVDMHRANEIRPVLHRLSEIAEEYSCAVLLIGHMNKTNGTKSAYRGLGSIDFQATARSVLIIGRIKDKPHMRIMAHGKSSLAPEGGSIAFELTEEKGFQWLGSYDITVDELLVDVRQPSKVRQTELLLQEILSSGAKTQKEIEKRVKEMGISKRTLDQAKANKNVKSFKDTKQWWWMLEK